MTTSPTTSVVARRGFYAGLLALLCALTALVFDLPIFVFGAFLFGLSGLTLALLGCAEIAVSSEPKRGIGSILGGFAAIALSGLLSTATTVG